ncbi:phosphocholine cytidylyltransferase family protein [Mesorhizobium japonicum]|uniref:Mlr9119 protein n=1 Tax=Mesorhizobium japonicum (strain LMG 29417 / CECT 9101 / MAFF 303099) TaxID=266835 RepID=Q982D9_RHILO|nr:phosphocholine cytidylyltransferase family protein [Mesorhizobium japonicum]BAB54520.1 mlr9119 [Mesorhizobium japonicum MAFF 303099]
MLNSDLPQSAIILAAGMGSRLRPFTNTRPKPLVEIHGIPIIHNALANLSSVGVGSVTIVVGYRKDAIEYACGEQFAGIDITYVESTVFDRTGSAYSLWLARDALLSGDVYLLEGDVFFDLEAIRSLTMARRPDVAAVAPFTEAMEGSAALLNDDDDIVEVRMRQTGGDLHSAGGQLFKTMNLFRFSIGTLSKTLVPTLNELIEAGNTTIYTEQLLAYLITKRGMKLAAARCDHVRWYEIDCVADLRIAEEIFTPAAAVGSGISIGHQRGR